MSNNSINIDLLKFVKMLSASDQVLLLDILQKEVASQEENASKISDKDLEKILSKIAEEDKNVLERLAK